MSLDEFKDDLERRADDIRAMASAGNTDGILAEIANILMSIQLQLAEYQESRSFDP